MHVQVYVVKKYLLTWVVSEAGVVRAEWAWGDCLSAEGALEGGGQSPRCRTLEGLLSHQHQRHPEAISHSTAINSTIQLHVQVHVAVCCNYIPSSNLLPCGY